MSIKINRNSKIISEGLNTPIERAMKNLERDIKKTCSVTEKPGADILLKKTLLGKEKFSLCCRNGSLLLQAEDALGFIYGIYEISRSILGITDYWFWNDQKIQLTEGFEVEETFEYHAKPFAVRYRGWFVNDEVLISTWKVDRKEEGPWEMVFEALLRQGGNMVIPGTERNALKYRRLAADMGLYITHHHAEPLGAEMFARAYPDLNPSYEEQGEKFRKLWQQGIEDQRGMNIIWNLGFRGQGDCPFWENDPRYDTPKSRGALMSKLIGIQYDMVKEAYPAAPCCTNLYGETMELYQKGWLKLPEDIIKIWADNGFGKMVSRRQGNHNPRIPSLPKKKEKDSHGIYYHVSFYDLQAANHITMLPNSPEFVKKELEKVLAHQADDYWLINCSNVKPHVYFLDLISELWKNGSIDIEAHRKAYAERYYGSSSEKTAECLELYHTYALKYGREEDEHAGEQYANHVVRMLVSQYMKDKNERAEDLVWLCDKESLKEQLEYCKKQYEEGAEGYQRYLCLCRKRAEEILEGEELFRDSLLLQAEILAGCFQGAALACNGLCRAMEKAYQEAFYLAGKARECYLSANQAMRNREHGKWNGFYANECLTDVKQTARVLQSFMSYVRNLGEGPHFYQWQREFLYSGEDRRVMLILNMENHLTDDELYTLIKEKWDS